MMGRQIGRQSTGMLRNVVHHSMIVVQESATLGFVDQTCSYIVCEFTCEVSQHEFTQWSFSCSCFHDCILLYLLLCWQIEGQATPSPLLERSPPGQPAEAPSLRGPMHLQCYLPDLFGPSQPRALLPHLPVLYVGEHCISLSRHRAPTM